MAEQEVIASEKPQLTPDQMIVHDSGEYSMLFDSAKFNQAYRVATAFAQSGLVPDHFKNNPAGVFVVLHMATRLALDPFMALQKVYMVHGRPGMEAQLVIALVNARGPFTGPIQWEVAGEGDKRQWTAYATHKTTGERCEATVTWGMVKAEGWAAKNGSKWLTIPDLMGRYRSATFLARLYCPEVILGLSTADELEDTAITLDSGVTVSHKPRTALPEAPEVDQLAVDEFHRVMKNESRDGSVWGAVDNYVSQIAKVNKQTIEAVKAQAGTPENFPAFWASFLKWHKPEKKAKSPKAAGEAKPENLSPTTDTQDKTPPRGVTEGQEPPKSVTPETLSLILHGIKVKDIPPELILQDWEVTSFEEMTEEVAKNVLAWIGRHEG